MILKQKDSLDDQIQGLEQAVQNATGLERQRREKDLAILRAGLKGEQDAAYHIDFDLKNNDNWAVIHDLRIEWNGRVAQIDHLMIDRFLEVYVVESKSFRSKVRYENGGWERLNFKRWEGIACPMEQNRRHILVLEELVEQTRMAPTRLGLTLRPKFINIVVVQPSCSIVGKAPDDARIYRIDKLVGKIRGQDPATLDILKMISVETLHTFAIDLLGHHKPAPKPVVAISLPTPSPPQNSPSLACQSCGGALRTDEADYCRSHSDRFASQLLCRKCQAYAPKLVRKSVPKAPAANSTEAEVVARCAVCGTGVDKKVVAFCRFNSKRFAGRILCRSCQVSC